MTLITVQENVGYFRKSHSFVTDEGKSSKVGQRSENHYLSLIS